MERGSHDRRRFPLLETLVRDLRYAARTLRRNPGFAAVAIVTMALGIGANTAIYGVARAVMFRPLPFPEPDRLVRIYETNPSRNLQTFSASIPNYLSWKEQARSLELAALIPVARNWTGDGEPERLEGIAATASFLPVLGTAVQIGRWFTEDEERPGQHRVVVLGDQFWRRRFAGDRGVLDSTLVLDGEPHAIIGVARPELTVPSAPDIWVAAIAKPEINDPNANRGNHFLTVIGRLRPGFTLDQLRSEMMSIARELEVRFPGSNKGWSVAPVPLMHWLVPAEIRAALLVLLGAVGLVMLIACANVANLLLARAEGRRKEMAIRAALGAGTARITQQLLTESLMLSFIGGALGVFLGDGLVRFAQGSLSELIPRAHEISIDMNVLWFAIALSLTTGLIFGLAPLASLVKMRNLDALHETGRTSQSAPRTRLRSILVVAQVSLAALLLVGAGLFVRSLARLQQISPGLDADDVITARIPLPGPRYGIGGAYSAMLSRLTDSLRSDPGVRAAGVSSAIPLGPGAHASGSAAALLPSDTSAGQSLTCAWRSADAGFFHALRIPILRGRVFDREDEQSARRVYVLSREAARSLFGAEDALGRRLRLNGQVGEVIGIVGDVRMRSIADPPDRVIYLPLSHGGFFAVFSLFVRADSGHAAAASLVRQRLREIDPNLPIYSFRPMRDWVENSSARARIRTWVLALLAAVALAIGAIGIYGVLSYLVSLRRHEFGVRLALGATPSNLLKLVLAQGLGLALLGIVAGLIGAIVLTRYLETLLFGVGALDLATFMGVASLLLVTALAACYVPARRAARTDPMTSLRSE